MRQLDLNSHPLIVIGNERRFPGIALNAIDELRAGGNVTLHF